MYIYNFFINFIKCLCIFIYMCVWGGGGGAIDPIGTIRMGKGWAYGPIPSPRIRAYLRTINKGRNENCFRGKGKEYLWRT